MGAGGLLLRKPLPPILVHHQLSPLRDDATGTTLRDFPFVAKTLYEFKKLTTKFVNSYRISYAIITTTTPLPPFGTTPCPHNPHTHQVKGNHADMMLFLPLDGGG
jgi:hypothetical protein